MDIDKTIDSLLGEGVLTDPYWDTHVIKGTYFGDPFRGGYGSGDKKTYTPVHIVDSWGMELLQTLRDLEPGKSYKFKAKNWTILFKVEEK